jgi:predicted PurR-regulated permease PerM
METSLAVLPTRDASAVTKLLILVGVVVVVAGLYFGKQILVPLALAVVFAFFLTPVVEMLERCHLGRVFSVLTVFLTSFALLAAVGWGVTNQLMQIMVDLPDYQENIHQKINAIRAPANSSLGKASAAVNDLLAAAPEAAENRKAGKTSGAKAPLSVQVSAPPRNATEYLRDLVGPLAGVLETTGIVVVFTLIILMKREDLRNRLIRLAGSSRLNVMTQAIDDASKRLSRYLLLQFVVNVGYGLLFGLGIYAVGVPRALLWGVIAGLLRFIPYIGTPVAALFPVAMAMAVFPGWGQVGLILALFLFLEITTANLIEPWLYGTHTGISSLAILVAAIFWGLLWGPVGLILSTPLTVCLILLGRYVPQLAFLEILLGDEPVLSPQAHFYQRLLALDDEEARDIADKYLKENPLGSLYDSVVIPALSLAEQDRHRNALDESRTRFIHQTARDLIDELEEVFLNNPTVGSKDPFPIITAVEPAVRSTLVCIPTRDEADEIVATMAAQLLRHAGHAAHAVPLGPVSKMLEQIAELHADVVYVSALPPFAMGRARSLCKQLRQQNPNVKIVLGLWGFPGGIAKAQERMGGIWVDVIETSLEQLVTLRREGISPVSPLSEVESDTQAEPLSMPRTGGQQT